MLRWLDAWLERRGLLAVVSVRMIPLAPFGLIGYGYGTTSVRPWHYLLGTAAAAAPSALSYAALGAAVVDPRGATLVAYAPAVLGLVISAAVVLYLRLSAREHASTDGQPTGAGPAQADG